MMVRVSRLPVSANARPTFPQPPLCNLTGIALDASQNTYVTNIGDEGQPAFSLAEFAANNNGKVAPIATISGTKHRSRHAVGHRDRRERV
jgi:hypothetical protein